ncbi:MAG: 6-bladed beta-propeller [bacterium]|nr:6-bladed beta-propeller [bacterium]
MRFHHINLRYFAVTICYTLSISNLLFAQKIEFRDGVKYIHNEGKGKWADDKNVRIEHIGTLGEIEDSDENYMFYLPSKIIGDKEGNLYVLDTGNQRIQKYDKDLKYILTFGERGQGPGEFLYPSHIEIDPEGNIDVYCASNGRIEKFTPEGDYVRSISIRKSDFAFHYLKNGDILARDPGSGTGYKGGDKGQNLFRILDSDFKTKRTFGTSDFFIKYPEHRKRMGANQFRFALDNEENIYTTFRFQNRIEKYSSDGILLYSMDREMSKGFPSKYRDQAMSVIGSWGIDVDSKGYLWVTARRKFPGIEHKKGVGINESGSLYVRGDSEELKFDHYILELYSNDGILLKSFVLSHWVDYLTIIDDRIYILDEMRGMQFHIYDIHIDK